VLAGAGFVQAEVMARAGEGEANTKREQPSLVPVRRSPYLTLLW
jgi:hypothetical protein